MGVQQQKKQAKKHDRIYKLSDDDICVLDYIEANLLTAHTKIFFVKNILKYGNKKLESCLDTVIQYSIFNKKVDKLTRYTCSNVDEIFFEICDILKEDSSLKTHTLTCLNNLTDNRTLAEIKEDLFSRREIEMLHLIIKDYRKTLLQALTAQEKRLFSQNVLFSNFDYTIFIIAVKDIFPIAICITRD